MTATKAQELPRVLGGAFLLGETPAEAIRTPEDLTAEERMMGEVAADFVAQEVLPRLEAIEHQEPGVMVGLLKRAGELGLLSADVPEAHGGLGLRKAASSLLAEPFGAAASFAASHGAHTCIGTLPLVYFGTPEQQARYLPRLASGEWLAAYALTEAGSGSDALAAKTTAVRTPDGAYRLNGTKLWITNAGFADLFTVFGKVDGKEFSAFLVERTFPGVSIGPEERKMGIKGSSTRPFHLTDAIVPAANLLGEVGRGHIIAFTILNLGRFKLGAGCVGGMKAALKAATEYAASRQQFGKPIASFGLIQQKLARMAALTFAAESLLYRTAGLVDQALAGAGTDREAARRALEEVAVECALAKVFCSEALGVVVDEAVQTFGGYGYSQEYPVERFYRDARINRIFEGTNEINRLLAAGMLLKRAAQGRYPLLPALKAVQEAVLAPPDSPASEDGPLAAEAERVRQGRQATLLVAGLAFQKYGEQLAEEQEVLGGLSDLILQLFAAESAMLRGMRALASGGPKAAAAADLARAAVAEGLATLEATARRLLPSLAEGDALRSGAGALRKVLRGFPPDLVALHRRNAAAALGAGGYPLA
ncbi:MAG TPA: acyl-CoA dehydrogenase family protein [Candidatus Methylomirabilis sp.]|jgi:hypothetical protein|nr:acyl-CoA dehydrogenase family protein [Candidatus Methylomirabilis sp.]